MNFEETITQSKVRLLRTSNSIGMDPHPKFGSSIETDDHTHTCTQDERERFITHLMKLSGLSGVDPKNIRKQFKREQEPGLGILL